MKKNRLLKVIFWIFVGLFFFHKTIEAEELPDYFTPVRAQGMGGAYTAIGMDQDALWTNPAGIGRIRKARTHKKLHLLSFPNAVVGSDAQGSSFIKNLPYLYIGDPETSVLNNLSSVIKSTNEANDVQPLWVMFSANPTVFFEPSSPSQTVVAIGGFQNSRMLMTVDANDTNAVSFQSITDVGGVLGFGFTNRTNLFNFGIQFRPMMRYSFDHKVDPTLLQNSNNLLDYVQNQANSGKALAIDTGVIWTFADFWYPSFGIAIFNLPTGCRANYLNPYSQTSQTICGTVFKGVEHDPDSLFVVDPTDIRAGVSITPRLTHSVALRFAVDMQHGYFGAGSHFIGLPDITVQKQMHAGVEMIFGNPLEIPPLSLRVGYSQGFVSSGVSLKLGFISIEAATFGKDISSTAAPQEDKRTVFSLSAEF